MEHQVRDGADDEDNQYPGDEEDDLEAGSSVRDIATKPAEQEEGPVIDLKKKTRKGHKSRVVGFTPEGRKARQASKNVQQHQRAASSGGQEGRNDHPQSEKQTYLDLLRRAPGGLSGRWVPQQVPAQTDGCWSLPGGVDP